MGLRGLETGRGGFPFLLLRTISNFTYEMVESLGGNCHGWQFQEKGAWMPLFSAPDGFVIHPHFISEI